MVVRSKLDSRLPGSEGSLEQLKTLVSATGQIAIVNGSRNGNGDLLLLISLQIYNLLGATSSELFDVTRSCRCKNSCMTAATEAASLK
jgi:hypothetical protein